MVPVFNWTNASRPASRGLRADQLVPGRVYTLTEYHQGYRRYKKSRKMLERLTRDEAVFAYRIGRSTVTSGYPIKDGYLIHRVYNNGRHWRVVVTAS